MNVFKLKIYFFFIHILIYAYIVQVISPPLAFAPLCSPPSSLPDRTCSAHFSNYVEE
jgi:hypothetical protein